MLRVIQAFGDHVVGESITDSTAIAEILETEQAAFVVAVADPEPEPAPPANAAAQLASNTSSAS
ncbi:hypothetical protein [Sphingomonas sp. 10B4]|uniref:hypothetical protein n=1 Tax=Sphingomonas sp. 10B4 TaxID=3048575 RepID=UPI002AB5A39F|nr:hypothetical protein [Sphingomonas sp. 10B4]MDY7525490.1 hypothetical protein [Sphingomonas sp. 10B4]MEB0281434.1 hypothetical protein [Sphingomonas sp. 10B4]